MPRGFRLRSGLIAFIVIIGGYFVSTLIELRVSALLGGLVFVIALMVPGYVWWLFSHEARSNGLSAFRAVARATRRTMDFFVIGR